ncbi:DUF614 domain containing protein [Niveomyces insectorum RCEF 264]|uniref:DUF614 domain containing protein n=1 Tax=Niveomyces insectorum RCEF 264 TaxID=1081102 RepID=A0A167QW93_9HYPO|nr:DUF614 domain containing protein [Niveomyces insectorum RCEF 264]
MASNGAINDKDVEDWKTRINDVIARPGEHVNQRSGEGAQAWHESFFGCCMPIDLCLMTYCLPCVTFGKTHHRLRKDANLEGYEPINTSCLLLCGSACVGLHWIPMAMQRADVRAKYNLQGDCLVDLATSCCCALCSLVQQEKEVAYRAVPGEGAVKQQYQAPNTMAYPGGAAPATQ